MCGIAGRVNFDGERPVSRSVLDRMTNALSHRGPDAAGGFVAGGAGLGHRRLSIIDLSTGDQPLSNEDGTIWIVFNGEIYNFAELRTELVAHGHRFRTQTDTEAIVHAYEEWGDAAVERLRGMFAFAIWDVRRRRLVLARDRLGVKPLHYALLGDALVFGSEIKAVLEDSDVPRDWSADALDAYMALQYVPSPRTIFKSVWKLPPGHVLTVENGRVAVRRYWTLVFTGDGEPAREREYLERLEALVTEAVQIRLVSDVPLGAFLSGGIDSTAVLGAMTRTSAGRVQACSVGFDEQAFNELDHARAVGRHLGADVHERIVHADVAGLLPKLAWHFDEPFADSSAVPTYYVCAAARERVTVALTGDGGDELWAGYARHRVEHWELAARSWLGPAGSRIAGRVGALLPLGVKGARSLRHLELSAAEACARKHAYGLFEDGVRATLYSNDFALAVADADPFAGFRRAYAACGSADLLDRALYVDVNTYLVDDILTKVDRMSMAVGLEARVPLLDHRLVEFAATVPTALKLAHGRSKHLLRRLIERRVPEAIVNRPKQGFAVPVAAWLRTTLAPMVDDLLLDGRFRSRGIFRPREVARLVHEHRRGRDHGHRLWSLLMLELWFRQFVDGRRYSPKAGMVAA